MPWSIVCIDVLPTISYPAVYTLPQSPYTFASETTHGCSFADSEEDQKIRAKEEQSHFTGGDSSQTHHTSGHESSSSTSSISFATAPESHSNNLPDNKDAAPSSAPALSPLEALQARLAALNAANEP